jgi:hypothetical protein
VYGYHDDDCRCAEADMYCNRDGGCWTCCGAAKEDSECTAPETHPTNPSHPIFWQTVAGTRDTRAVYRSNEEIAELYRKWRITRN